MIPNAGVRKTTTTRRAPRGEQFYTARRLETQRETKQGQYRAIRYPYPNQTEFGRRGEWTDAAGRHYRIATKKHPSEWTPGKFIPLPTHEERQALLTSVKGGGAGIILWVKVPRGAGTAAWFTLGERQSRHALSLHPIRDGIPPIHVQLLGGQEHGKGGRGDDGRTGKIQVTLLV